MKHFIVTILLAAALCDFTASIVHAQDGFVFSAQPPIAVRRGTGDGKIYFTNTSDKVLHGITVNNKDDEGNKTSKVIIDTIEAHKTVAINTAVELLINEPSLTCTSYSKPLPLNLLGQ